eukprot:5278135-Pyramimonas_sp.AAC.1
MHTAGFPASSWPLVYHHANWLRNRLPSERLGFDTPRIFEHSVAIMIFLEFEFLDVVRSHMS